MPNAYSFEPTAWLRDAKDKLRLQDRVHLHGTYGPLDACTVVDIRDKTRHRVTRGVGVPADLFILSIGEGDNRAATKIGGLPNWEKGREWPKDPRGNPLPFLAQFNLSESKDLVGDTKGDLILLFGHADPSQGCLAMWMNSSSPEKLVASTDLPIQSEVPSFLGTRWRTENYPDWNSDDDDVVSGMIILPDGKIVYSLYYAYELMGMQIGRSPFIPPDALVARDNEKIICTLSGIAPALDEPYPFLNQVDPLDEASASKWIMPLSRINDIDGFGIVYVVCDLEGRLRCVHRQL